MSGYFGMNWHFAGSDARPRTIFRFMQCASVVKYTGEKAYNLHELRDSIALVSERSIFHHTYQYFLKGKFLEYTNDFSEWVDRALGARSLAESLSSLDPYEFSKVGDLRRKLIQIINDYIRPNPAPRGALPGSEFCFNEALTFVFPTGITARNLAELLYGVKYAEVGSIYYHFYEARVRLRGIDDFSCWIENVVKNGELAQRLRSIDPFSHNIEKIRGILASEIELAVMKGIDAREEVI